MAVIISDLLRGLRKNRVKYILFVLFLVSSIITFFPSNSVATGDGLREYSFTDELIYLLRGNAPFNPKMGNKFMIQPLWLVMSIMPSFLVYSYAVTDMEEIGLQFLVRSQSRAKWWFSKCVWNICSILVLNIILILTLLIVALPGSGEGHIFELHNELCVNEFDFAISDGSHILFWMIIMWVVISIGVSLFQMALSLITDPMIAFIMVVAEYVLSAYFSNGLLIGNYTMIKRWQEAGYSGGYSHIQGILLSGILAVSGIVIGYLYIKKMDVRGKEKC